MPSSKPRRQHEVPGVILARLHAALQATSDTWQRCRAPTPAPRARPQSGAGVVAVGRIARERPRGGWKPGITVCHDCQPGSREKQNPSMSELRWLTIPKDGQMPSPAAHTSHCRSDSRATEPLMFWRSRCGRTCVDYRRIHAYRELTPSDLAQSSAQRRWLGGEPRER